VAGAGETGRGGRVGVLCAGKRGLGGPALACTPGDRLGRLRAVRAVGPAGLALLSCAGGLVLTRLVKQTEQMRAPEGSGAEVSQRGHLVLALLAWCSPGFGGVPPSAVVSPPSVLVAALQFGCRGARSGGETVSASSVPEDLFAEPWGSTCFYGEGRNAGLCSPAAPESPYVDGTSWNCRVRRCAASLWACEHGYFRLAARSGPRLGAGCACVWSCMRTQRGNLKALNFSRKRYLKTYCFSPVSSTGCILELVLNICFNFLGMFQMEEEARQEQRRDYEMLEERVFLLVCCVLF